MKTQITNRLQPANPAAPRQASLRVRTDLRAGAWNCGNCVGTVNGSQMLRPTCEYCRPT